MRSRAWRRQQREKMLAHAKKTLKFSWNSSELAEKRAHLWADNMRKCSCIACNHEPGPHPRHRPPPMEDFECD